MPAKGWPTSPLCTGTAAMISGPLVEGDAAADGDEDGLAEAEAPWVTDGLAAGD
jgi:hypothetical protein